MITSQKSNFHLCLGERGEIEVSRKADLEERFDEKDFMDLYDSELFREDLGENWTLPGVLTK